MKQLEIKLTESRKLKAKCNSSNAEDARTALETTMQAMATKLDGWHERMSNEDIGEQLHNGLKAAVEESNSMLEGFGKAVQQSA